MELKMIVKGIKMLLMLVMEIWPLMPSIEKRQNSINIYTPKPKQ